MADEPEFTITGIDRETGEQVSYPLTPREVEEIMIAAEHLPDPNYVDDGEDDD